MMRKFMTFGFAAFLFAMLFALAACQSGGTNQPAATTPPAPAPGQPAATAAPAQPTPPAELIRLTFWNENADPTRSPVLQDMVERFNASQDRIHVEYTGIPQADAMDRYNVAIAGGLTPDIGGLQENWLSGFILREAILPLDQFFDNWDGRSHMVASAIDSVRSNAPDGQIYMMPTSVNTQTIWVRQDWLNEHNLGLPNTWDAFFEAVETMTDTSQLRYGHTIRGGSGGAQAFFQMLYSFSGEPVFDENNLSTVNRPANVEFTERYFNLYRDYTPEADITAGWTEIAANFGTGISGTLIHNLGSYQNHVDNFDDYDMFVAIPPPVSQHGNRNMSTSSIGYMIFADTPHPEAAWEFITFMLEAENNSIWNQTLGQLPTNSLVMAEDWVSELQHITIMMEALLASSTTSMNIPIFLPEFATIASRNIEPAMQQLMVGQITAQEMLDMWAGYLDAAMDDYVRNVLN